MKFNPGLKARAIINSTFIQNYCGLNFMAIINSNYCRLDILGSSSSIISPFYSSLIVYERESKLFSFMTNKDETRLTSLKNINDKLLLEIK
jgi:hypothetical protein